MSFSQSLVKRMFSSSPLLRHRYYTDLTQQWWLEKAKRDTIWRKRIFRRGEVDVEKEAELAKMKKMKKAEKPSSADDSKH